MSSKKNNIEITPSFWLGDIYQNDGWKRLTLFYKQTNLFGGSLNTPVAEIDIVEHPSMDGINSHCELKINFRNDVIRQGNEIHIEKITKELRTASEIVDNEILSEMVERIKENGLTSHPLSIYVCVRHVESFATDGEFWNEDK